MGWIDPFTKTDPKLLLVSSNPNLNKSWILAKKKNQTRTNSVRAIVALNLHNYGSGRNP
jgi:hypothetical protein